MSHPAPENPASAAAPSSSHAGDQPPAQPKLPLSKSVRCVRYTPPERDLAIYRATQIEHKKQRDVALEFKLSPTRVSQLVRQVEQWAAYTLHCDARGLFPEQRLNLAEFIHRERLEFLYGQSVDGWRQSLSPVASVKTVVTPQGQREERTVRNQVGHVKYLAQAGRFADQIARLDGAGVEPPPVEPPRLTKRLEEPDVENLRGFEHIERQKMAYMIGTLIVDGGYRFEEFGIIRDENGQMAIDPNRDAEAEEFWQAAFEKVGRQQIIIPLQLKPFPGEPGFDEEEPAEDETPAAEQIPPEVACCEPAVHRPEPNSVTGDTNDATLVDSNGYESAEKHKFSAEAVKEQLANPVFEPESSGNHGSPGNQTLGDNVPLPRPGGLGDGVAVTEPV